MDDASYWMFYVAAGFSAVSVVFSVWVAYSVMQTQAAIDELETLVLAVLDDALQIMVPTAVLNHISQYDIANFEMKTEAKARGSKKVAHVCYAEDVSQPLSEKSQMYYDFGDQSGPAPKKKLTTFELAPSCEIEAKSPLKVQQSAVLVKSSNKSPPRAPNATTPIGTSPRRKESKADIVTSRNQEPSTARVINDNQNLSPKKLPAKCSSKTGEALRKGTPKNKTVMLKSKEEDKDAKASLANKAPSKAVNKATSKPTSDKKSKERTIAKKALSKETSKKVTEKTLATENDEKKIQKKKESKKEKKGTKEGGSSKKGRSSRSKKGKSNSGKKGESTKKTESEETGGSGKSARTQGETMASSKG